jgi:hypothetical protein
LSKEIITCRDLESFSARRLPTFLLEKYGTKFPNFINATSVMLVLQCENKINKNKKKAQNVTVSYTHITTFDDLLFYDTEGLLRGRRS